MKEERARIGKTKVLGRVAIAWGGRTSEAHDWFLKMMREHEEFEIETDRVGEPPMPFWSETVGQVVVE